MYVCVCMFVCQDEKCIYMSLKVIYRELFFFAMEKHVLL